MNVEVKDGKLVITLPLQPPTRSKTGRSLIVATTSGFQRSTAKYEGSEISVSVNACIPLR